MDAVGKARSLTVTLSERAITLLSAIKNQTANIEAIHRMVKEIYDLIRSAPLGITDWDPSFGELVEVLKMSLLLQYTCMIQLGKDRMQERMIHPKGSYLVCDKQCQQVMVMALRAIESLVEVINEKQTSSLFLCIMSKSIPSSYKMLDIIRNPSYRVIYQTIDFNFSRLLKLMNVLTRKSRSSLTIADSKNQNVPYTTFASNMGQIVNEILTESINLVEHVYSSSSSRSSEVYDRDSVSTLLLTICEVINFSRLDSTSLDKLLDLCIRSLGQRSVELPLNSFLKILLVILSSEDINIDRLLNLPKVGSNNVNPIINQTLNYLSYWVVAHVQKGDEFWQRTETAVLQMKVLSVLAKFHYCKIKNDSLKVMVTVLDILKVAKNLQVKIARDLNLTTPPLSKQDISNKLNKGMDVCVEGIVFIQSLTYAAQKQFPSPSKALSIEGKEIEESRILEGNESAEESSGEVKESPPALEYRIGFTELFQRFLSIISELDLMNSGCNLIPIAVVECMSTMSESLYHSLDENFQRLCVVSILGYARDIRPKIRSLSGRCIAHFLEFSELVKTDYLFVLDALDVIEVNLLRDQADIHSFTAYSWALGNLANTLAVHYDKVALGGVKFLFLFRIYCLAVQLSETGPKTRYNAHRTLGCLLRWAPAEFVLDPELAQVLYNSVSILESRVAKGADYKTRWNASYSLGCILQNEHIVAKFGLSFIDQVVGILANGMKTTHFKEKGSIIKALCSLKRRYLYGDRYFDVWALFMNCFVPAESKAPCCFKILDRFHEAAGDGILHLIALLNRQDLLALEVLISENLEVIRDIVGKNRQETSKADHKRLIEKAASTVLSITQPSEGGNPEALRLIFTLAVL